MRILGIDPGYALMGFGVIEQKGNRFQVIDYGSISTGPSASMPERLKYLYSSLMDIIAETNPDQAALEELFYNTNAKTVINVGQARGVAVLACVNSGLPVSEYTPLQIKQALVGYGRAEKKQVQQMVKSLLGLEKVPKPDDTADALAVAICHANSSVGGSRYQQAVEKALRAERERKNAAGKGRRASGGKTGKEKNDDFRIIRG